MPWIPGQRGSDPIRFNSRDFLRRLPLVAIGVSLFIMAAQIVFNLPPLSLDLSGGMGQYTSGAKDFRLPYPKPWLVLETPGGEQDDRTVVVSITDPKVLATGVDVTIRRSMSRYSTLDEIAKWGADIFEI